MTDFLFGAPKSLQTVTAARKLEDAWFLEGSLWQHRQCIKNQRWHFADKGPYSQSYGLSSSPVQMWELDHKKGWMPKNWCLQIVVLEKILENPLDTKEIKLVNLKENQYWILTGKTVDETEAPIFCPPVEDSWLVEKDPDAGKDWRQKEKGTAEVEIVG